MAEEVARKPAGVAMQPIVSFALRVAADGEYRPDEQEMQPEEVMNSPATHGRQSVRAGFENVRTVTRPYKGSSVTMGKQGLHSPAL